MEDKPLISIVVPIYNVEKYLYKSIESIRKQTYSNLEIILVDDGSPDRCGEIIDEFSNKDKRIKVLHKKNGGLSDARNAGLRIATGEYVFFFDSDDYMSPQLIEVTYKTYQHTNTDLVCFNYISYDEDTCEKKKTSFKAKSCEADRKGVNLAIAEYLKYHFGYCVWNKLYCMGIIRKYNIQFEDNSKIFSEDICFNLYYIIFCKNVQVIGDCLYYYLNRETSIMGRNRTRIKLNEFIQISKFYEKYLMLLPVPNSMFDYQELVFSMLMQMQLQRVARMDRLKWIDTIEDKDYFNKMSDKAIYRIDKWIDVFGILKGIKQWLKAIEYYYGEKKSVWIYVLKWMVFHLKQG